MPQLILDHLVIATPSLKLGAIRLEALLGCALAPGGQHLGHGTHNRLLNLDQGVYLELIAPDPDQPEPDRPRPFALDRWLKNKAPDALQLVHAVARVAPGQGGIEAIRALAPESVGPAASMRRADLVWQISGFPDRRLPAEGGFPTVIDWGTTPHPSTSLPPSAVGLTRLRWVTAQATVLAPLFAPPFTKHPDPQPVVEVVAGASARLLAHLTLAGKLRDPLVLDSMETL